MNTPICDFVKKYIKSNTVRLHMPGHKGQGVLGCEAYDITEIKGADSLYETDGVIKESEDNASLLFGCPTYYSTEGSSLCIRAMLYLTVLYARGQGNDHPYILAGRNVHRSFVSAVALMDVDVMWLYSETEESGYLSCDISPCSLEEKLISCDVKPVAVYITSPDYLGHVLMIEQFAKVCHKYGVLLLVDNAHGAYLKFLSDTIHPMDAGADLCCDSAHKTLPVLTGGAYLHMSHNLPHMFFEHVKTALAMFGSTSPSYLILQSLDAVNAMLSDPACIESIKQMQLNTRVCRNALMNMGWQADISEEPLKLTIKTGSYGYTGNEVAEHLRKHDIECEFCDPDYIVLMMSFATPKEDITRLIEILALLPRVDALVRLTPHLEKPERAISPRQAVLLPSEWLPIEECIGRIAATTTVGCPPAVPIVVSGEYVSPSAVECMRYYSMTSCAVVKFCCKGEPLC